MRELKLADFAAAIAFVDRVAELAEAANHHPDILVHGWNKVRLTLSTHSAGRAHRSRLRAGAREIDALGVADHARLLPLCGVEHPMNDDEELPRSSVARAGRLHASRTGGVRGGTCARVALPGIAVPRVNGLKLIITALLIAINAFFVIAEYALVRSRRARLEVMREEGARGASLALEQIADVNEYISAVQIGVTMTSIGVGALGEPALAAILKPPLGEALEPRRGGGDRGDRRVPAGHRSRAAGRRRDGAEVLCDRPRGGGRAARRAAAAGLQRACSGRSSSRSPPSPTASCGCSAST